MSDLSSSQPEPSFLFYLRAATLLLFGGTFLWIGSRMRPLLRWKLRRSMAKDEFSTDEGKRRKVLINRVFLVVRFTSWDENLARRLKMPDETFNQLCCDTARFEL